MEAHHGEPGNQLEGEGENTRSCRSGDEGILSQNPSEVKDSVRERRKKAREEKQERKRCELTRLHKTRQHKWGRYIILVIIELL